MFWVDAGLSNTVHMGYFTHDNVLEKIDNKIIATLILAFAIIFTAWILGNSFKNRNENLDSISVIGLGTKDFISDEILWTGSFSVKNYDIKEAYNKMKQDQKTVSDFFISKGFKSNEFTFGAVNFNKRYREIRKENPDNPYQNQYEQVFDGYEAYQTITFKTKKNAELMKKIDSRGGKASNGVNLRFIG